MPKKARAMVLKSAGMENYEIQEFPVSEPASDAVVAKVLMCGVCGTDVHITRGRLPMPFPTILGHEWCGQVESMGKNVTTDWVGRPIKVGDYITTAVGSCGKCWFCRNTSRDNLCEKMALVGIWPEPIDKPPYLYGAYAEYTYVEPNMPIFKLPEGFTPEEMVMVEPIDVVARVWTRAQSASSATFLGEGVNVGQSVVIIGSGPIGQSCLVTALVHGMGNVIMVDPIQERLNLAKELGATHIINPKEVNSIDEREKMVKEITYGIGADLVVEAAGEPPAFVESLRLVRRGGTVVEMGHFTDTGDATINPHRDIVHKDIQLLGSWAHTSFDMKLAPDIMLRAKAMGIPFGKIVQETVPLEKTAEAVQRMKLELYPAKLPLFHSQQ